MRRVIIGVVLGIVAGRLLIPDLPALAPAARAEWSTIGALVEPRQYAQSVRLATGEILIDGGMGADAHDVAPDRAMLLDPASGRVRYAEANVGRMWQTLTTLADGRVLAAGGVEWNDDWVPTSRADIFDPHSGRWSRAARLREARSSHSAALLQDGRVLVVGGNRGARDLASAEIYDPASDEWTFAKAMPTTRTQFAMSVLPDGRAIVIGGREQPGLASKTTQLWDPRTDRWAPGPDLRLARILQTAVTLANGDVLVIGGDRAASNGAERYDATAQEFVYAGMLAHPRIYASAVVLGDGRVAVAGGIYIPSGGLFAATRYAEIWSPASNRWDLLPALERARVLGVLAATTERLVYVGGADPEQHPLDVIEAYPLGR